MKYRRYGNPPITEALCEFQFDESSTWNSEIPDRIYSKIKKDFPQKRKAKRVTVNVTTENDAIQQTAITKDLLQFFQADGKTLIQVAPNLLSINRLAPYTTWKEILPLIRKTFENYRKIAEPKALSRIGVRYINIIEFNVPNVEISRYFNFFPALDPAMPQQYGAFFIGLDFPDVEQNGVLKLELTSTPASNPSNLAMVLNLDYFTINASEIKFTNAIDWVDNAHTQIERIFELSIKDELRKTFRDVEES